MASIKPHSSRQRQVPLAESPARTNGYSSWHRPSRSNRRCKRPIIDSPPSRSGPKHEARIRHCKQYLALHADVCTIVAYWWLQASAQRYTTQVAQHNSCSCDFGWIVALCPDCTDHRPSDFVGARSVCSCAESKSDSEHRLRNESTVGSTASSLSGLWLSRPCLPSGLAALTLHVVRQR